MSSIEENKRMARRFLALVSEHKVEELCEMIAPTWTMHGGPPGLPPGPDGVRELFRTFDPIEQKWTIERAFSVHLRERGEERWLVS